ncbi:AMP-binding protein [Chromobacterium sp. CV08]|uniref:AMP-binding protein n=1 Tax=Chromobacterium sp. CV08 TaxID=3133274 RepID=UPI003DA9D06E
MTDPIVLNARKQAFKDYIRQHAAAEYRECPFFATARPAADAGAAATASFALEDALNARIFAMASASPLHRQSLFSACLKLLAYRHCREEEGVLAWAMPADGGVHLVPAAWRLTAEALAQPAKRLIGAELAQWRQVDALGAGLPPETAALAPAPQVLAGYSEAGEPFDGVDASAYALAIWIQAAPAGTRLHMRFDGGQVEAELASLLMARLALLLHAMAFEPGGELGAMPWMPQAERERVDALSAPAPSRPLAHRNVAHAIAASLRDRPEAIFLECDGRSVDFAQLARYTELLLGEPGWPERESVGDCVLIVGPKGVETTLAAMVCIRIGKPFCLQSDGVPRQQLSDIVALQRTRVVLLDRDCEDHGGLAAFFAERGCRVIDLPRHGAASPAPAPFLAEWLRLGEAAEADDALCVLMTSGSEGQPKGSVNTHRALLNLSQEKRALYRVARPRAASTANHMFDYFVLECVEALSQDMVIVMVPDEARVDAGKCVEFLRRQRIDMLFATTVLAEDIMALGDVPGLSQLYFGGESLRSYHKNNYELFNVYGPSETGVFASYAAIGRDHGKITVGKPVGGCQCVVVFPGTLEPCPIGVAGELLIGGAGVGTGYLNRPDLTERAFLQLDAGLPSGRYYRTGDLGCWDVRGEIEVLGRRDRQLKVNGFRVELDAIEQKLLALPGVAEAVVIGVADKLGHARLGAFVVADDGVDEQQIRAGLAGRVPAYMVPGQIILSAALPLTRNGKLDRRALKQALDQATAGGAVVRPRGETEQWLAACWARHLELAPEALSTDRSFFSLGGHSLRAARMLAELRQALGCDVSLPAFFRNDTIAALARLVDDSRGGAADDAFSSLLDASDDAAGRDGGPLSAQEARLYAQYRLYPDSTAYVLTLDIELPERTAEAEARRALQALIDRHDILRTRYRAAADGTPFAEILPSLEAERVLLDERDWAEASGRPFALEQAPPLRGCLMDAGGGAARLRLQLHHILVDKPALEVLDREFGSLLRGETPPPAAPAYRRYAAALAEARGGPLWESARAFWQSQLQGLEFDPFGHGAADAGAPARTVAWRLSAQQRDGVRRLCAELAVTPAACFLALWGLAVARESGCDAFSVSVANALRPRQAQETVGMFVTLLPCAFRFGEADGSLADYVRALADAQWRQAEQRFFPVEEVFPLLTNDPRRFGSNPLLNVAYSYIDGGDGREEAVGGETEAHGPLNLAVVDAASGCSLALEYQQTVFAPERIAAIADTCRDILRQVLSAASAELPLAALLRPSGAAAFRPPQRLAEYRQIDDMLRNGFLTLGSQAAVIDDDGELDWEAFAALTAHYARRLNHGAVRRALILGRTGRRLQAFLAACFLTRTTYLALESGTPEARVDEVLRHAEPDLVIRADEEEAEPAAMDWRAFDSVKSRADNPIAWILYSSGTTGRPKGICVAAQTAAQYVDSLVRTLGLGQGLRVVQQFSPSFDGYLEEVLLAWALQGVSVVADRYSLLDPRRAQAFLSSRRPDVISAAPALFSAWNRMPELQALPGVGISGGDFLAPGDINRLLERMRIWNSYGPTETCIAASMADCAAASGPTLTIGAPFAHVAFAVLDPAGRRLRPGQWGELAIYGDFERHGYLNDEAQTAARFGRDEAGTFFRTGDLAMADRDGLFHLKGRMDDSCKVRGNLIGLGELEGKAGQYPGVAAAGAAVAFAGTPEACLVLAVEGSPRTLAGLQQHLARHYTRSHLPSAIFPVDSLPRTDTGKLDRAGIVARFLAWRAHAQPAGGDGEEALEPALRRLIACWRQCLGYQGALAPDSDFFLVSGSSLSAVRLASRLEAEFGVDFSPADVFRNATVGAQRDLIEARRGGVAATADAIRERRLNADVPGTPRLLMLPPVLGGLVELQALAERLDGLVAVSALTLEQDAARHLSPLDLERALLDALRPHAGDRTRPLWLGGYSLGAEMLAALLERRPEALQGVDRLVFLDPNLRTGVFDGPALYAEFLDFFGDLDRLAGAGDALADLDEEALRDTFPALHREWCHYRLQHGFLQRRTFAERALPLDGVAATLLFSDDADEAGVAALALALQGRGAVRRMPGGHAEFVKRLGIDELAGPARTPSARLSEPA